ARCGGPALAAGRVLRRGGPAADRSSAAQGAAAVAQRSGRHRARMVPARALLLSRTGRSRSRLALVERIDAGAVAFAQLVATDLECRGQLAVVDREGFVGQRELAHTLDHRKLGIDAVDRRS